MGCDAPNHPPFRGQQVSAIEIAPVDLDILDVLCATAEMAAGVLSRLQQGATETAAEFARASARRSDQSRQPRVCNWRKDDARYAGRRSGLYCFAVVELNLSRSVPAAVTHASVDSFSAHLMKIQVSPCRMRKMAAV